MTARTDFSLRPDRPLPDRRSHAARLALLALQRGDDMAIDRDAARRITVARLHAGSML